MRAREAVRAGAQAVARRPAAALVAMLGGATAELALSSATTAAARLRAGEGHAGAALGLWLIGGLWAALVLGMSAAGGISSLRRVGPRLGPGAPAAWLGRGTATLSLWALERVLLATLALAAFAPPLRFWANHPFASPVELACAVTFSCAGPLVIALLLVPAFRVAVAGTATGVPAWLAFAEGIRMAAQEQRALWRLIGLLFIATSPLWLLEIALGRVATSSHGAATMAVAAFMRGALAMLAMLWGYAAIWRFLDDKATCGELFSETRGSAIV